MNAALEMIERETPFRASRRPECICVLGPDPGCRIDHQGIACDRETRADEHMADPAWLVSECYEAFCDENLWRLFIAGDYAGFGTWLRTSLKEIARDQAKDEIDENGVSL